jgi:Putative transposase DNA-binding domain
MHTRYLFRKLKLGSYSRRQITEARMLKRFEKLFGAADEAVVCIGDWEQRQHRRFKEPVKGRGFRTLFRRAGYKVYLVDEYHTSKKCSACSSADGVCSTFRMCDNPRPYKEGRILRHGLVKCKTCSRLWNRDVNASSNIWKIASRAIRGLARPVYLQRAQ